MDQLVVIASEAEHTIELPMPPLVIGAIAFVILLALLAVTLAYGKGRQHS